MRTATATCAASTEPRAQHRKLLQHDLKLGIVLQEVEHVAHRAFAITAIVIEELDEGDVAVLVAEHDAVRRVEDRVGVLRDTGLVLLVVLGAWRLFSSFMASSSTSGCETR